MNKLFTITIDGQQIEYTIIKSKRKSVSITVSHKDGVIVRIPSYSTYKVGESFVESRKEWISTHLKRIEKRIENSPNIEYIDGEELLFLGRKYILRIIESNSSRVDLCEQYITVYTKSPNKVEIILKNWYKEHAHEFIVPLAWKAAQIFHTELSVKPISIEVKYARRYWGICTSKGAIRFNVELIRADVKLIEYVIVHELCHLLQHNHSPMFYKLLEACMPDYKQRRKQLRDNYSIVM